MFYRLLLVIIFFICWTIFRKFSKVLMSLFASFLISDQFYRYFQLLFPNFYTVLCFFLWYFNDLTWITYFAKFSWSSLYFLGVLCTFHVKFWRSRDYRRSFYSHNTFGTFYEYFADTFRDYIYVNIKNENFVVTIFSSQR